jgi:hypothetical protein
VIIKRRAGGEPALLFWRGRIGEGYFEEKRLRENLMRGEGLSRGESLHERKRVWELVRGFEFLSRRIITEYRNAD